MLSLIYGSAGSGKTSALLKKLSDNLGDGREAIVIVSDQDAVTTERRIAGSVDEKYLMSCDVLSFRRLANRVFRERGGVAGNYIGRGGKLLILMRVLRELSPKLEYYRSIAESDANSISLLLDSLTQLKRMALSPAALTDIAERVDKDKNPALKAKLSDLALIWESYSLLLKSRWQDAEEDLDRLCGMLDSGDADYFSNKNVYIDSFSGFSGQEYEILARIFRTCPNVTMTVGMLPNDEREQSARCDAMQKAILRIAARENVQVVREAVLVSPRSQNASLAFLRDHLFAYDGESCADAKGVRIISCADPIEEVTAAAKAILAYVQSDPGARFRDCAVTMRTPGDYAGIVEGVFASHGIPFYFSRKEDLSSLSLCRLIFSALAIKRGNWRCEDVLSYIKCGFAPIDDEDSFALEKYIVTWNIEGRRRYEEQTWDMNPAGCSRALTEEDAKYLSYLDEKKKAAFAPVIRFCDSFSSDGRGKATIESVSRAIYNLLCELNAPKVIDEAASDADQKRAQELAQSWDAIMLCLDEMVFSAGDLPTTAAKYYDIFKTLLSNKSVATIPTSNDEVTVCDAYNLRANDVKNLFVLGANDGIFPSAPSGAGLFSERDIETVKALGYELPGGSEEASNDEYHILASAITSPSDALTLFYHTRDMSGEDARRSGAIDEMLSLFPALKEESYRELEKDEKLYGRLSCIDGAFEGAEAGKALLDYYLSCPDTRASVEMMAPKDESEKLSSDTVERTYGDNMHLSQSRINTFVSCPFSYTCKYILSLDDEHTDEPSAADAGNVIHFILERALRGMTTHGGARRELSDAEITKVANEAIREYKKSIFGDEAATTTKMEQLFRRLRRLAKVLLTDLRDEFAQSKFTPVAFELPIGSKPGKDGLRAEALKIPLEDGSTATIGGVADRVDAYKNGSDVYLRVIDYKTSDHVVSMDDVRIGLNAQMLIYMEALLSDGGKLLRDAGVVSRGEDVTIHPAGVLYYIAKLPNEIIVSEDGESIQSFDKITRNGLLINDMDALRAMEANLAGRFIPTKVTQKGELSKRMKLPISEDEFSSNLTEMVETIAGIAMKMRSGSSEIAPLHDKKHDGCQYCTMRPVCRRRSDINDIKDEDEDESEKNAEGEN